MNKILPILLLVGCAHLSVPKDHNPIPREDYKSAYAEEGRLPGSMVRKTLMGASVELKGPGSTSSSPSFADITASSITLTATNAITFDLGDRLVHGGSGGNYCRGAANGTWECSAGFSAIAGGFTARNATASAQVGTAGNAFWYVDAAGQFESTAFIAYQELPTGVSIANNAVGASPATYTSTFSESDASVSITCSDPDGCNVTLTETSILDGQRVCYVNVSANTVNFADSAGVSELAGAFAAGQWDSICLQYRTDRWVELSRSNN